MSETIWLVPYGVDYNPNYLRPEKEEDLPLFLHLTTGLKAIMVDKINDYKKVARVHGCCLCIREVKPPAPAMSKDTWENLRDSGIMWELFPAFNGEYKHDLEVYKKMREAMEGEMQ